MWRLRAFVSMRRTDNGKQWLTYYGDMRRCRYKFFIINGKDPVMKRVTTTLLSLLMIGLIGLSPAGFSAEKNEGAFDLDKIKRIDEMLDGHIQKGELAGAVAYIFQPEHIVHFKAYGLMDIEHHRAMDKSALFRIASMTKPLTAVAALKLYEQGKFLLDDPVSKYIPELRNLRVLSPTASKEGKMETVPIERDITIRDLFRHTAGFGYSIADHPVDQAYRDKKLITMETTLPGFIKNLASFPLEYQPGSKWEYSYSIDVLGYLVERVSSLPLDQFMKKEIFDPLKMNNTFFWVPPDKTVKLTCVYEYKDSVLKLVEKSTDNYYTNKKNLACVSGGGGLPDDLGGIVTTAEDYGRFCRMLLDYGKGFGKRILSPASVELMISNQIAAITDRSFPVDGYGLGIGVTAEKNEGRTQAVFWAGGPYNTTFNISYKNNYVAILLMQNLPWQHLGIMGKFMGLVEEAVANK
jgi:CubicO group peptidase (beta-lactamase class C family)